MESVTYKIEEKTIPQLDYVGFFFIFYFEDDE